MAFDTNTTTPLRDGDRIVISSAYRAFPRLHGEPGTVVEASHDPDHHFPPVVLLVLDNPEVETPDAYCRNFMPDDSGIREGWHVSRDDIDLTPPGPMRLHIPCTLGDYDNVARGWMSAYKTGDDTVRPLHAVDSAFALGRALFARFPERCPGRDAVVEIAGEPSGDWRLDTGLGGDHGLVPITTADEYHKELLEQS